MMARKVMSGSSGVSITSPNHPNIVFLHDMESITGPTLFDASPSSLDGTITGATQVAGHLSNAMNFTGGTDGVDLGNVFSPGSSSFSVWAWIKTSDATVSKSIVQKRGTVGGPVTDAGFFLAMGANGVVAINTTKNATQTQVTSVATVNDGVWHLVGANVARGGTYELFIDNISAGTLANATVGSIDVVDTLAIGAPSNPGILGSTILNHIGDIDNSYLYNITLNSAERAALWNSGAGVP